MGSETAHHHFAFLHEGPKGFVLELFRRFNADRCAVWAASLSFFALLSLIPLLVGSLALVGLLIHDPQQAAEQVQHFLAKLLPIAHANEVARKLIVSAGVERQAEHLRRAGGWAGVVSIITFLYTASRIYVNAIAPMNAAFRAQETRNIFHINLIALALLLATSLLFLVSLIPASGIHLLHPFPSFPHLPKPPTWWQTALLLVMGVLLNAAIFSVLYRFLPAPGAKVSWKMALGGGMFVAVIFELAKEGFAMYLRNLNGGTVYDKAYGSLGVVAILFLWIYASSQLLLLGAELTRLFADTQTGSRVLQQNSSVLLQTNRPTAVQVAAQLADTHKGRCSLQQNGSVLLQTNKPAAVQVAVQRSRLREGSSGWVSKKFTLSREQVIDTMLGSVFLVVILAVSLVVQRSSGQRSS